MKCNRNNVYKYEQIDRFEEVGLKWTQLYILLRLRQDIDSYESQPSYFHAELSLSHNKRKKSPESLKLSPIVPITPPLNKFDAVQPFGIFHWLKSVVITCIASHSSRSWTPEEGGFFSWRWIRDATLPSSRSSAEARRDSRFDVDRHHTPEPHVARNGRRVAVAIHVLNQKNSHLPIPSSSCSDQLVHFFLLLESTSLLRDVSERADEAHGRLKELTGKVEKLIEDSGSGSFIFPFEADFI